MQVVGPALYFELGHQQASSKSLSQAREDHSKCEALLWLSSESFSSEV